MSISDYLKLLSFGADIAAAMSDVSDFNERMDAAKVGEEVLFDIPDNHEPTWPMRLHGGHRAQVSQVTFRKKS